MPEPLKSGPPIFRILLLAGGLSLIIAAGQRAINTRHQERYQRITEFGHPALALFLDRQAAYIPAGEFVRGSDQGKPDERPAQRVYLDGFSIDIYEVTNLQYQRFVAESGVTPPRYWSGGSYPSGMELYPVVGVRWKDAQAYCLWAGKRLPTEAEWEKACRGTAGSIYPWGNQPGDLPANVTDLPEGPGPGMWDQAWDLLHHPGPAAGQPRLEPVGDHPAGVSIYGIHDLVGNASEWTADHYNWDGYWNVSTFNPLVTEPAWNHVVRGSAWLMPYGHELGGYDLNRCSARSSSHGDTRDARIGFRCAWSAKEQGIEWDTDGAPNTRIYPPAGNGFIPPVPDQD